MYNGFLFSSGLSAGKAVIKGNYLFPLWRWIIAMSGNTIGRIWTYCQKKNHCSAVSI